MLARSISKCYHRLSHTLITSSHIPSLRVPAQYKWPSSILRFQSSTSSPPLPPECDTGNDDTKHVTPNLSPTPPSNPTTLHHDLPTFLAHARRTTLSPTSTTYVGTYYEYIVQSTLRRLAFDLRRTGGRGDAGIDLIGTWHLPHGSSGLVAQPLRVLVQCKALKAKLGPNLIRELEGAFVGAPGGYRGKGVVGVLVSPREATKGVRDAMGRSRWPMVWVMLEVVRGPGGGRDTEGGEGGGEGRVRQVLWNKAARDIGLEGLDVTVKYHDIPQELETGDELGRECVLMWQGKPVPGLKEKWKEVKS